MREFNPKIDNCLIYDKEYDNGESGDAKSRVEGFSYDTHVNNAIFFGMNT